MEYNFSFLLNIFSTVKSTFSLASENSFNTNIIFYIAKIILKLKNY